METASGLLSSVHASTFALHQQSYESLVARGIKNAAKLTRRQRNTLYRRSRHLASLPQDAREFHQDNPRAEGLPCAYNLRFANLVYDDEHPDSIALNSSTITVGQLGQQSGLHLNGEQIESTKVSYAQPTKTLTFSTRVKGNESNPDVDIAGLLDFSALQPSGTLNVGARVFNVVLDPKTTWFDVQISTDSKARVSSGRNGALIYDKDDFDKATWEDGKFAFGYDHKSDGDLVQPNIVIQNHFIDTSSTPSTEFHLRGEQYGPSYTCVLGPEAGKSGSNMLTRVTTSIPRPPESRKGLGIETVFPQTWNVQFSDFGDSFYGAYQTESGAVYGVKGNMKLDGVSLMSMLTKPATSLPVVDTMAFLHDNLQGHQQSHAFQAMPSQQAANVLAAPKLRVHELLGMDVMVPDANDSSGYRDSVAQLAMKDFHNLIVYFMDEDLRTTFIQGSQIVLPDYLLQIAQDSPNNSAFYKKLQVPLITSTLANGTMDEGKYCNGARAERRLKTIPSTDPVYQSHSSKLYRYHFLRKFPSMQKFLNDQRDGDHSAKIDQFIQAMKTNLEAKSEFTSADNPNYAEDLKSAQDEIDRMGIWAKDRNLFWALQLLYWTQNSSLPNWYTLYTSGASRGTLTMNLKKLNVIFGVLENDAKNPAPNGKNFMQAFNQDVRLFQMVVIVPLLIDADGVSSELDTLTKECLEEYIERFKATPDDNHAKAIQAAQQLYTDTELRKKFFLPWAHASRIAGATGAWYNIATLYEKTVSNSSWFKVLKEGSRLLEMMSTAIAAGLIIIGCMPTMRDQMSDEQKALWGVAMAGLVAMIVINIAQKIVRFVYFYNDLSTFGNKLKCILGFEKVIDQIENSAYKIESGFARFFARTSKQAVDIGRADAALLKLGEKGELSLAERAIGRNMAEVLGTVLGLVLAIVSIVLAAIDLHKETDALLRVMDIMMLCSAVIQLVAVVAGIIVGLTAGVAAGGLLGVGLSALTMCAAWGGPVAIVFALVGVIILVVWESMQDSRSPAQKFLDDRVGPAGLRMAGSNQAPEYFSVVPAKQDSPSLVGLGILGPVATSDKIANDFGRGQLPTGVQGWLKLNVSESNIVSSNPLDYSPEMVWSMSVDADGKCLLYTTHYTPDEKDPDKLIGTIWYLATDDSKTSLTIRQMPDDDAARAAVLTRLQWTVDITTKPEMDDKAVMAALVTISQGDLYLGKQYHFATGHVEPALQLKQSGWTGGVGQVFATLFRMSMQPLRPTKISYTTKLWKLVDTDTDKRNVVQFVPKRVSSAGLSWSISPALPNGFQLVTSGEEEGTLIQSSATKPAVQQATEYTVFCQLPGKPDSAQSCKVTIQVDDHTKIVDLLA